MARKTLAQLRAENYQLITDRLLALMEQGTAPWQQPWASVPLGAAKNGITRKPYRGINAFMLACMQYENPYWLTFKQSQSIGGSVAGERGTPIIFWSFIEKPSTDAEGTDHDGYFFLKRSYVFNVVQCSGIDMTRFTDEGTDRPPLGTIEHCRDVVNGMPHPPQMRHGYRGASYNPFSDVVAMPYKKHFDTAEDYYATLFHELAHSTGHATRLNRPSLMDACPFGSTNYSKEELIAEMTAAFLCSHCQIENKVIGASAAYLSGWGQRLKGDAQFVVNAAAHAQKAADYILRGER